MQGNRLKLLEIPNTHAPQHPMNKTCQTPTIPLISLASALGYLTPSQTSTPPR